MSDFKKSLEKEIAEIRKQGKDGFVIICFLKRIGFNMAVDYFQKPAIYDYEIMKSEILLINNFCEQIEKGE